ncbi:hypothetical protein [Metabacillus arenae]|uniref:Uncharacterized protein n=1 Tax=Metabacillus arenae TaxID=2771434 RepID=A0A926NL50_9BACI|nr:hypothetical protein [Metabacillus arenae]MBD1383381.1 hypothetical protein [Metabacillus arenae]
MKKLLILLILIVIVGLFYIIRQPEEFPTTNIEASKALNKLEQSDKKIVNVGTSKGSRWYLTHFDKGEGQKRFIKEMENQGWIYIKQEGSGILFEKSDQELKTTCVIWNSKYNVCNAPLVKK